MFLQKYRVIVISTILWYCDIIFSLLRPVLRENPQKDRQGRPKFCRTSSYSPNPNGSSEIFTQRETLMTHLFQSLLPKPLGTPIPFIRASAYGRHRGTGRHFKTRRKVFALKFPSLTNNYVVNVVHQNDTLSLVGLQTPKPQSCAYDYPEILDLQNILKTLRPMTKKDEYLCNYSKISQKYKPVRFLLQEFA